MNTTVRLVMSEPVVVRDDRDFEAFVREVDRPLRQALVGALGSQRGADAHAAALEYAWTHRDRVTAMASPIGYLFKVGRSSVRLRRRPLPRLYPSPDPDTPEYEPKLPAALAALPERQRVAVFLAVGCGWSFAEVARLEGTTESTIRTHVQRGLGRLRKDLGAGADDA
jgi:DNA-directed RNA polymerase specialized sigma24 family protein